MSHNVHPYSFRLGIIRDWKSRWFDKKEYHRFLKGDVLMREWLTKRLRGSYVADIGIERSPTLLHFIISTSRPGMLIGKKGEGIDTLRKDIIRHMQRTKLTIPQEVKISIEELRSPESNSAIVSQMIAEDLERRLPFRRVMKKTLDKVITNRDVEGIKVKLSGRLGGAEMSRVEWLMRGRVPLQTLRADIDFARERAHLPYGDIGIKVWIYRGEKFAKDAVKKE
ncbi:MAG: 30S ribosomal protein S3 [Candidatus Niyogibacteria bacterium CG10_big_fil_rev_8_21_14_0_10_46_36]|uniref:Small ribosomal subunit protein uS3 n=1 Tax=Candidatus Niyogibacteria bacterium CG10_big_fil_rev_8_21_14_0_10_46_36 TaxID=1974726 RepID=A0A2H0TDZ2_9BACT|nr:MAG: 30S ribosomal protein S3 [Candidatus Niyogibacteria bacterium CG10_big_fil_rev_8_21_14_0_10_46_36]